MGVGFQFVTVVMINRNGGSYLVEALRSCRADLERTLIFGGRFELVVVDNGSTDTSLAIIDHELSGAAFPWRAVTEAVPGVNSARNAGVKAASGDVIIFVDSDLQFEAGWLLGYLQAFEQFPRHNVFGGRVKVGRVEGDVPEWLDLTGPYSRPAIVVQSDYGDELASFPIGSDSGPVGPNMAFRRAVFDRFGCFDVSFGLRPGSLAAGAESEFFCRLERAGEQFVYVADSVVLHPVRQFQLSKQYFLRRLHGNGRAVCRIQRLHGPYVRRMFGVTRFVVRRVLETALMYMGCLCWGNAKRRFYLRGELAFQLGYLHEDLAMVLNRIAPSAGGNEPASLWQVSN